MLTSCVFQAASHRFVAIAPKKLGATLESCTVAFSSQPEGVVLTINSTRLEDHWVLLNAPKELCTNAHLLGADLVEIQLNGERLLEMHTKAALASYQVDLSREDELDLSGGLHHTQQLRRRCYAMMQFAAPELRDDTLS